MTNIAVTTEWATYILPQSEKKYSKYKMQFVPSQIRKHYLCQVMYF